MPTGHEDVLQTPIVSSYRCFLFVFSLIWTNSCYI